MKKLIVTGLVTGLVLFQILGVSAYADSSGDAAPEGTPEKALLISLLALEGQNLSQSELEEQIKAELAVYEEQANPDGQQERLEQAFVDLKLFTPAQAHSFMEDSQSSLAQLLSQARASRASDDPSAIQNNVAATMNELAALHPVGAEFSACTALMTAGTLGFAAGATMVVVAGIQYAIGQDSAESLAIHGGIVLGVGVGALLVLGALSSHFTASECVPLGA